MANYVGMTRSNYFQVKERARFEQFCDQFELEVITADDKVGFIVASECGEVPIDQWDEAAGEYVEVDFMNLLAEYLAPGQVAVVMEIGYEKMRYLIGRALAVNAQGQQGQIDLAQIYDLARSLGEAVTAAEY